MKIFLDGPTFIDIKKFKNISGYTFNPSLFKKLGAKKYINFTKKILKFTSNKDISIEVIGDDYLTCLKQALKISKIDKSIRVKIPITYSNGKSTKSLIEKLIDLKIKLNITAIFTLKQIKNILPVVKNSDTVLSIFSGRLYDIGINAANEFKKISAYVHKNSKCKTLWASCRMAYDIKTAYQCNADIITIASDLYLKSKKFGYNPVKYSRDTVKGFLDDAKKSKFII
jgi:transaldolase|tara:strand:- start:161 stop:841 length:681 start_codon:yes stop_codon:yes gene_type:complete